jgi:DNA-nicking Smr family endonuclease
VSRRKELSDEDRILWHRVARSVKPMPGRELAPEPAAEPPPERKEPPKSASAASAQRAAPKQVQKPAPSGIDTKTHGKIAKGRLSIDARIDLHGMTQAEAHGLLLAFLHRAHASGLRHVLVITGKGRGGDGILRRAVPAWLSTAPFRGLVSAHAAAARQHGGEGALYIRLRRAERGDA